MSFRFYYEEQSYCRTCSVDERPIIIKDATVRDEMSYAVFTSFVDFGNHNKRRYVMISYAVYERTLT
jgi:hypothetical protein